MEKIQTIFDRDWEGNRGVVDIYINDDIPKILREAIATEKLDGTNVRLTVRNHKLIRLEKRRNPDKRQKAEGITEPWYVEAGEYDPQDKFIWEAARSTNLKDIEDGEWSGEAVGKKIQGNPLNLEGHQVCLFSCKKAPELKNVPVTFNELKEWLPKQKSSYGSDCGIEGIVWHWGRFKKFKIKLKDFK